MLADHQTMGMPKMNSRVTHDGLPRASACAMMHERFVLTCWSLNVMRTRSALQLYMYDNARTWLMERQQRPTAPVRVRHGMQRPAHRPALLMPQRLTE